MSQTNEREPKYTIRIERDNYPDNPREVDENFGKMICWHRHYKLGDEHNYSDLTEFLRELVGESLSVNELVEYQDLNYDDYPQLRDLFDPEWFKGGFSDSTARIAELMRTPEGVDRFIGVVSQIAEQHPENKDVMKSIGLLIMLDNIMNRVMLNRKKGKHTRVYIDDAHLFFKNPYSAEFLLKAWKRFRKYGGLLTGLTQNIEDCLRNDTARGMLANSEFLLMLNQAPSDRIELSQLLGISAAQMSYITNAPAGHGLMKVGGSIVPFANDFPTDTQLYKLMSTKLSDVA